MEKIAWLVLGTVTLVAALRAYRSRRALAVGRGALGVLYLGAGALVNAIYLAAGATYADFADAAHIAFVRDTWRSLVAPHHVGWITLLIMFEAVVGVLVLCGGRRAQLGMVAILGHSIGLLVFGWVLTIWGIATLLAVGLLLRAERRWDRAADHESIVDAPRGEGARVAGRR